MLEFWVSVGGVGFAGAVVLGPCAILSLRYVVIALAVADEMHQFGLGRAACSWQLCKGGTVVGG